MDNHSLWDHFEEVFIERKEKSAVTFLKNGQTETEMSYGDLRQDVEQMAGYFADTGLEKGDRIILFLPKSVVFVVAHLAAQRLGAVSVPLNPGFTKTEMTYFVEDTDAALILAGVKQASLIRDIDPQVLLEEVPADMPYRQLTFFHSSSSLTSKSTIALDDPGLIVYTSGTTGKPKGAVLTQKNMIHDAENIVKIWEMTDNDRLCHSLPLFHVHGLCFALHTALLSGAHVVMLDEFSCERVIDLMEKDKHPLACSVFMGVPAMYRKLMDDMGDVHPDFSMVRLWTSGSAPLLPSDFDHIRLRFGKAPVEREGMSETGMNFSNPIKGKKKPGSIGLPLPNLKVRIVNQNTHEDVIAGQTGEIWLKGPSITPGYWRNPEATNRAFENGWFRSGDLGYVDDDGYYYITDRLKHIIISGGENISPKEIESAINRCEGIEESAVVGIPDEKWGEKVVVAVVLKPDATLNTEQIISFCREHLHAWKVPKAVKFLQALPRNTMGKVLKEEIKALFE